MPAHLNEISPRESRATFPGFTYQFGNFLAAGNATIQVVLADRLNADYGMGMALVAGAGAIVFALLAAFGPEARDVRMMAGS
jgi:SHS family lactate transporter-like MFS transporter